MKLIAIITRSTYLGIKLFFYEPDFSLTTNPPKRPIGKRLMQPLKNRILILFYAFLFHSHPD
ncbi:MAG TPA: hypothetical protein DCD96_01020 [Flavobacteriales bacterium]|nr:hypothetical protein [Flavobacteriales bacterium]